MDGEFKIKNLSGFFQEYDDLYTDDEVMFIPNNTPEIIIISSDEENEIRTPDVRPAQPSTSQSRFETVRHHRPVQPSTHQPRRSWSGFETSQQQLLNSAAFVLGDGGGAQIRDRSRSPHEATEPPQDPPNDPLNETFQQIVNSPGNVSWDQLVRAVELVKKNYPRRQVNRFFAERRNVVPALRHVYESLQHRPPITDLADTPDQLSVQLMQHQRYGLRWLRWREEQSVSGGILADDMGLGKTLQLISMIVAKKDEDEANHLAANRPPGLKRSLCATLIVCPLSVISQWQNEIRTRLKRPEVMTVLVYHGPEKNKLNLEMSDVVITTYETVSGQRKIGKIYDYHWNRIILDEAHKIRNPETITCKAICELEGKYKWAVTGTPIHNKVEDMQPLLHFMNFTPFDDLRIFRRWLGERTNDYKMLSVVSKAFILRRTKEELMAQGVLVLPDKCIKEIEVTLDAATMRVYQRILLLSRTLFADFLQRRAERLGIPLSDDFELSPDDREFLRRHEKMLRRHRRFIQGFSVILVLLLRLRQICCHASLITSNLLRQDKEFQTLDPSVNEDGENNAPAAVMEESDDEDDGDQLDLFQILSEDNGEENPTDAQIMNRDNWIFNRQAESSKIKALLETLEQEVEKDKCIIVSEWTGFLDLIADALEDKGHEFVMFTGITPPDEREQIVRNFNNEGGPKIMLLSLTAGGVGLNLVGANHIFICNPHWNPQLEAQARDRIYRVGQTKPVNMYKFTVQESIEKRIVELQQQKLSMAQQVLGGLSVTQQQGLTINDLKILFST